MDYKVLSENIEHPLLKPVLEELIPVFEKRGIKFYIIGAVARDIILDLNDEKSQRVTMDLDIAIAIDNWGDFEDISSDILSLPNFSKDEKQQQRFLFKGHYQVDIVPYGDANQNVGTGCKFILRNDLNDSTFECIPKGTTTERLGYFANKESYIGNKVTAKFYERTINNIPFHANVIGLRNYEE